MRTLKNKPILIAAKLCLIPAPEVREAMAQGKCRCGVGAGLCADPPGRKWSTGLEAQRCGLRSLQSPLGQPLLAAGLLLLRLRAPGFAQHLLSSAITRRFPALLLFALPRRLLLQLLDGLLQAVSDAVGHPVAVHRGDEGVGRADLDELLAGGDAQVVGMEHHSVGPAVLLAAVGEVPHDGVADGAAVNPELMGPP